MLSMPLAAPAHDGQERERYRRWWIESSGLSARVLYEIAVGLVL